MNAKPPRSRPVGLRQANTYNRSLIEASLDPLVTIGTNGKITDVNAATEAATGCKRAELIGTDFSNYFTEPEKARAGYQQVFRDGFVRDYPLELRHRDGHVTSVLYNASVYRDAAGKVVGVFAAARDLTERKRAEEVLRESEARYRVLFNGSADGIVIADVETKKFKYMNPALCRMLGYTEAELCNLDLADIHPPESLPHVVAEFEAQARGDKTLAPELPCLRKDGSIFFADITATKITIDGRPCNVGIFRDITERKQTEAARLAGEQRLHELNILQELLLQPNSPDQKLKLITDAVVRIMGADFARIWMIKPGDRCAAGCVHAQVTEGPHVCRFRERCLHLLASSGRYTHKNGDHGRVPFGCYKIGKIASGEEAKFLTNDAANDPRVHNHAWAKELGLVSFAGYRLVASDDAPLGVLALFSQRAITAEEDLLLEGIAHATSLVLRSARAEESLRMFQLASDNAADAIFWVNQNAGFYYVNDAACRSLGYTREELMRLNLFDIDPVISRDQLEANWQRCRDEKLEALRMESRQRRKDGSNFPIEVIAKRFNFDGTELTLAFVRDMTERKQAEEALQQERKMLRTLIDNIPDYIYVRDLSNRFVLANESFARLMGVPRPSALIGRRDADFYPPELAANYDKIDQEVFAGRLILNRECVLLFPNGQELAVLSTKVPFKNDKGEVIGLIGVGRDITGHRRMEEALRREQELFNCLAHSIPDCIYFKDRQSRFVRINESMAKLFGLRDPAEAVGKTDSDIFSTEHARQAYVDEQRAMETGEPIIGLEEKETWPDGRVTWASTTKIPLRDAGGKVTGLVGISRDITERKRAEESHARLGTAVEQAVEAIVITDRQGTIQYVNPAFEKTSGYTRAEAVGQNPRILKSGKHDAEFYRRMWEVLKRGEIWKGHFINKRKDGTLYEEETVISSIRDTKGAVINYVAVKRDVTREVQLEAQFRQSQKMEAFGQLAGGVAHDFNNILAIIQMQAGLLKGAGGLSPEQVKFANDISTTVDRAAALTRQLLLFSRKEILQPRDLDLSQSVTNMTKMLRRTLGENIEVRLNLAAHPMFVHADAAMLDQLLLNLAVNARDAMPRGGQLAVTTAGVEFDEPAAAQSAQARPGSFVCLSVADSGCGIPPEILPRIFEPFFTTKDVGKGTGLGLATVFGIVEQHKGWINVHSEVGCGTTFKVYLPRLSRAKAVWEMEPMPDAAHTGHETILLVEDETSLREVVQTTLAQLGYRVLEAPSGVKAIEVWKEHREKIHLMLTDLMMPDGITGTNLAQHLLRENPRLKVIYMSGYSAEIAGKDLPLVDGVNFLSKPFTKHKLAETVRNSLDKQA